MRYNIKLSTVSETPVNLLALSRNVVAKMTGNSNFTTPIVDLATMSAKADELEVAIEAATEGSKSSRADRDVLVVEMNAMLRVQANYVRALCDGSKAKLVTSGYELAKQPEPIGIPGVTLIREVKMTGIVGQVELKWKTVRGAKAYQVWMTDGDPNDPSSWQPTAVTSRISSSIDNLKSYHAYWFCISVIGAAGEGAKSDPAIGRAA